MVTTVSNSLSPTTVSCSSNRAVWVQHLGRFAEGIPLDKNLMDNHFHYIFFQSVEALEFIDNTERILFCHSLGLFLGNEQLPLLDKKAILALKDTVFKMRYVSMNQMAISFLEIGVIPECPVYQKVCSFIKKSKNSIPKSVNFWTFFFNYLLKKNIPRGFNLLLKQMNHAGFLNKIKLETLNIIYDSSILFGVPSIKNLLIPMLYSFKQSTLNQKYLMTLFLANDLAFFKKEFNRFTTHYQNILLENNDFIIIGEFIKKFWLSDSFWAVREKLNLNSFKELNKYSLFDLSTFWAMIHHPEQLQKSLKIAGLSTNMIPQFPKDFTFAKAIQYLPKQIIKNIRYYLKNEYHLFFHLAQGKNIRNYSKLPFPLSKKAAHYCFEYLNQFENLDNAIKKAKLKCWGAKDHQMYDCLNLNIKYFDGNHSKFIWQSVFNSVEEIRKVVPLHRVITHLSNMFGRNHFSHKNDLKKEITSFLKAELKRKKTNSWSFTNFKGYYTKSEDVLYRIIQLDNPNLLKDEGKNMSHCVSSYTLKCKKGECSIWSLRSYHSNGKEHRIATIEVNQYNKIVQVKSKANQTPKSSHKDIILEWVIVEDLSYIPSIL